MEQRLISLEKKSIAQYTPGSPLLLKACALYLDNVDKQCIAQIKWKNIGTQVISAVLIDIVCFDAFGHTARTKSYQYNRLATAKGQYFGTQTAIPLESDNISKYNVVLKAVSFNNGTIQEYSEPASYIPLSTQAPLCLRDELLPQYKRDLAKKNIKSSIKGNVQRAMGLWQCVCGSWQLVDEVCISCGANETDLITAAESLILEQHLAEYNAEQERRAEEARIAQKEKEEEAQRREQQRKADEAKAAVLIKKRKQRNIFLTLTFALVVALFFLMTFVIIPQQKYDTATALMTEAKYKEAIDLFATLKGFSDSPVQIQICWYAIGKDLAEDGRFSEAAHAYESASGYLDSVLQAKACWYEEGKKLASEESWREAIAAFSKADQYADCHKQLILSYQHLPEGLFFQDSIETNVYGIKANGRVLATGGKDYANDAGQRNVDHFRDIVRIIPLSDTTIGITNSGSLVATGKHRESFAGAEGWSDVTSVLIYYYDGERTIIGLKRDGTIVATGGVADIVRQWSDIKYLLEGDSSLFGLTTDGTIRFIDDSYPRNGFASVAQWDNIKSLVVANGLTNSAAFGLKEDGTIVVSGHDTKEYAETSTWTDIQQIAYADDILAGLKADGTVVVAGKNVQFYHNYAVKSWTDISSVYCHDSTVWGIQEDGSVVAAYSTNKSFFRNDITRWDGIVALEFYGDAVIGHKEDGSTIFAVRNYDGNYENEAEWAANEDVVEIAVNRELALGLKSDGTVNYVEYGTGLLDYNAERNRNQVPVSEWTDIVKIYVHDDSAYGIKADGTVVAAGFVADFCDVDVSDWKLW